MKITSIHVVQNPTPGHLFTLGDICHELHAATMHHWFAGAQAISGGADGWKELGVTYYTEREEALADAVVRLGRQAGIDEADSDYRAGSFGDVEDPFAEPCAARADDGCCEPGRQDEPGLCVYCGEPIALDVPIEGAMELPDDLSPKHRASAVRAFVRAYNEQMRALEGRIYTVKTNKRVLAEHVDADGVVEAMRRARGHATIIAADETIVVADTDGREATLNALPELLADFEARQEDD